MCANGFPGRFDTSRSMIPLGSRDIAMGIFCDKEELGILVLVLVVVVVDGWVALRHWCGRYTCE